MAATELHNYLEQNNSQPHLNAPTQGRSKDQVAQARVLGPKKFYYVKKTSHSCDKSISLFVKNVSNKN